MLLLPLPDPLGILLVAEVFFVPGLGQPGFLAGSFSGFLAAGLRTESLALPMSVISKKMSLTVQAVAAVRRSLHRFQNQRNQCEEKSEQEGKKIRPKKNQSRQEGRKLLSESSEENAGEEDPFLNRPFCALFKSPLAHKPVPMHAFGFSSASRQRV